MVNYKGNLSPLFLLLELLLFGHLVISAPVFAKSFYTTPFPPFSVVMDEELRQEAWSRGDGYLVNPQFQEKLDLISDSTLFDGNRMEMLQNGMMSYPARFRLIDLAQKSIVMTTLSIDGGESKKRIDDQSVKMMVARLIKVRQRGVKVFIIYDGFSSFLNNSELAVKQLKSAGVELLKYNPMISTKSDRLWRRGLGKIIKLLGYIIHNRKRERHYFTNRWHEKALVVDGRYAVIGGINWGDRYAYGNMFTAQAYPLNQFLQRPLIQELQLQEEFDGVEQWVFPYRRGWRDNDILLNGPIAYSMHWRLVRDFLMLKEGGKRSRHRFEFFDQELIEQAEKRMESGEYRFDDLVLPMEMVNTGLDLKGRVRYISQRPAIYAEHPRFQMMADYGRQHELFVSQVPASTITNYYINMINHARHQILWGTFSFHQTDEVLDALGKAATRGVKIYLITNSRTTTRYLDDSGKLTYRRSKKRYKKLIRAGYADGTKKSNIRIFEWLPQYKLDGTKIYSGAYHSKNFSVDGVLTAVGSYNIARASAERHVEGCVVVVDPDFNRQHQQMFTHDLKFTREVKLKKRHR